MGNSRLHNRLHSKYIFIGGFAVMAFFGSAISAIAFDFDHLLAYWLGIENSRFLHHPQAIFCCVSLVVLSWWIIKLVRRLHRSMIT